MLPHALTSSILSIAFINAYQIPFGPYSHSENYVFKPLLHLPGISPYFDAVGAGLDHAIPAGCTVTAATYLIRHAAIYANDKDYETYIEPFLKEFEQNTGKHAGWSGPLEFLGKWTCQITDPKKQLEEITPDGKKSAKKVGKHLLSRYPHLVPTTKHIYADKKSRTQDTAKALARAFKQHVEVRVINTETSFHAQIPHKACPNFSKTPGDVELNQWIDHYTPAIIARLRKYAPRGFNLTSSDIIGLQQLCGYESAINGKVSPICDVFTDVEWSAYEYAWDMKYYYMVGHGSPLSPYLGFPFLNATSQLFQNIADVKDLKGPRVDDGQRFFLSFTHREVPPFIATALGLFNSSSANAEEFPTDRINWSRSWRMAELVPFLGHLGFEKLRCQVADEGKVDFVRVLANSSPRPIPNCQTGPGASCPFEEFVDFVARGMEQYGDLHSVCGNSTKYVI